MRYKYIIQIYNKSLIVFKFYQLHASINSLLDT